MQTYKELKIKHADELNNFTGIFFAFNNEQFKEGIEKVGASKDNKIVRIGAGGYILKNRVDAFNAMLARHKQEKKDLKKNNKILLDAIVYELDNHEYSHTLDARPALNALEFLESEIDSGILNKAKDIVQSKSISNEVQS